MSNKRTEIAALEQGVTRDQVSLLVILVDPKAALFAADEQTRGPASRSLTRQLAAARKMAHRDRLGVATAYGILQRECVWQGSQLLEKKRMQGRFQVLLRYTASAEKNIVPYGIRKYKRLLCYEPGVFP